MLAPARHTSASSPHGGTEASARRRSTACTAPIPADKSETRGGRGMSLADGHDRCVLGREETHGTSHGVIGGHRIFTSSELRRLYSAASVGNSANGVHEYISFEDPTSNEPGSSTRRSCGRTTSASTARVARAFSTGRPRSSSRGAAATGHTSSTTTTCRSSSGRSCASSRSTCSSIPRPCAAASCVLEISMTREWRPPPRVSSTTPLFLNRPGFEGGRLQQLNTRRWEAGNGHSTGSRTSAGRCRSVSSTRPTTTATSRHVCASGSAATGATAAATSTGGAPNPRRRSSVASLSTNRAATRSPSSSVPTSTT